MKQQKNFIVDILFVLALFGVFTLSALMLVSVGAEVYQHTVTDMGKNYETRTSVSYLTEKIRQSDYMIDQKNIFISDISDIQTLVLAQELNEETYHTYLYFYDGYLKELFTNAESNLGEDVLSAGHNIMELSDFNLEQTAENLLSIRLTTPGGKPHVIYVSTHCTP